MTKAAIIEIFSFCRGQRGSNKPEELLWCMFMFICVILITEDMLKDWFTCVHLDEYSH